MMTTKYFSLAGAAWLFTLTALASQTAAVRMYCTSIEVDKGTSSPYGHTVDFNYANLPGSVGEFAPQWPGGIGSYVDLAFPDVDLHTSAMNIYDGIYKYTCSGYISIGLPMATDANNNRFPDFFEVALPASYTMTGNPGNYYFYDWQGGYSDYGLIDTATWTRTAGSVSGSYSFKFYDTTISPGYWGTFRGTFKIYEYTGTLTYTPGSNVVSGVIDMVQTGVPSHTFHGPIQFTKVDSDRFNSMTNQPAIWTDANSVMYNITNHYFFRDPNYPTNYAGYIEFDDDGDANTVYPYAVWVLSITDLNDSNHNGVPDFSDDPTVLPPPRRPQVELTRTATNLLFTIHGDINHVHQIQYVPNLTSTDWQNGISVTLTNDPQVVPVTLPTGSSFYRIVAQ